MTKSVLKLSFGSVFKKNEERCDSYFDEIICWSCLEATKVNDMYYKIVFPDISKDEIHRRKRKEFDGKYFIQLNNYEY